VLGGKAIALAAADNYRRLRRRGFTPRKTIDMIIATYCIAHGLTLLHADRGFRGSRERTWTDCCGLSSISAVDYPQTARMAQVISKRQSTAESHRIRAAERLIWQ
jgi:hypothetical protein